MFLISHVTLEIDNSLVTAELGFWAWLGYKRLQRTRQMGHTEWLRSWPGLAAEGWASSWIHLVPVPAYELPQAPLGVGGRSHVAVVIGSQFARVVRTKDWPVYEAEEHWGKRVFTRSPSGWRIEILEAHPRAAWPGAPRED